MEAFPYVWGIKFAEPGYLCLLPPILAVGVLSVALARRQGYGSIVWPSLVILAATLATFSSSASVAEYLRLCLSVSKVFPWVWEWRPILIHITWTMGCATAIVIYLLFCLKSPRSMATAVACGLSAIYLAIPAVFAFQQNFFETPHLLELACIATSILLLVEFAIQNEKRETFVLCGTVFCVAIVLFILAHLGSPIKGGVTF